MTKVSGIAVRLAQTERLLDRVLKLKDRWQVRALRAEGAIETEHIHRDPWQPGRVIVHSHTRGHVPHGHHGLRYGGVTQQATNPTCPLCGERPVEVENKARMLVCRQCNDEHGDNDGDWR